MDHASTPELRDLFSVFRASIGRTRGMNVTSRVLLLFVVLVALGGGTAGEGSTPHANVLTEPCTSDAQCDDGQFCNGRESCDVNGDCVAGTPATCCGGVCAEAFPRCADYSENAGAGCQSDADCKEGPCERCQRSCAVNDDCSDGYLCNGIETCRHRCLGGPTPGMNCFTDPNCGEGGKCIGYCQPGINPCGSEDCAERICQNVVPTQYCQVDSDCPAGAVCRNISPPVPGFVCFARVCGDGVISGSEECDPNANLSNPMPGRLPNGCYTGSICLPDSDPQKCTCTPFCGNDHIENGEECDGFSRGACPSWCGADCTCAPSSCGNGIVEPEFGEECEDDCDCYFMTPCRRPGDPMGECTCTCLVELGLFTVDWDPDPESPDRTTRSLRFRVSGDVGCEPHDVQAIKITMVDLQHLDPRNLPQYPPANYSTFDTATHGLCAGATTSPNYDGHHCSSDADCLGNDDIITTDDGTCLLPGPACTGDGVATNTNLNQGSCARWVGKPQTFYESQGPPQVGPYRASRLQCTPFYWDWITETASGPITVVGAEIVPSSEYGVRLYASTCKGSEAGCADVSFPVTMYTRRKGDLDIPYQGPSPAPLTQADVLDISQAVAAVKHVMGAPEHFRAQMQPILPELNTDVNVLDIVEAVDSVKRIPYSFPGPCVCPSMVACGGSCTGCPGLCVKTCVGGDNDGEPCINNTHCPGVCVDGTNPGAVCSSGVPGGVNCGMGGTCSGVCSAIGTCRDKCGRCSP